MHAPEDLAKTDRVIAALALAGIHAADCPRGEAEARQKRSPMYISVQDYECTCWVNER